jgi:hypothetical protein
MTNYRAVYGEWAGRPQGSKPDLTRCCESVYSRGIWVSSQCANKNGHGPDGEYCKTHDPGRVAEKNAAAKLKSDTEWAIKMAKNKLDRAAPSFLAALRLIAEGHNDARGLAAEAIKDFPIEEANV